MRRVPRAQPGQTGARGQGLPEKHHQEQRKADALGWAGNDYSLGLESLKISDRKKHRQMSWSRKKFYIALKIFIELYLKNMR